MELLALVKLANTGLLLWEQAGPLLQAAMERGDTEVSMEEVEAAAASAGMELDTLRAAIAKARTQA